MFFKARIKLTGWYLLIIMLVSVSFSMGMYNVLTHELDRMERVQRFRQERLFTDTLPDEFSQRFIRPRMIDPEIIEETKHRLILILVAINAAILAASSVAGYFLAGRTLGPIADMVDEQSRFISDASHELRTPLTALKTATEVGLRDKVLTLKSAKSLLVENLQQINSLQNLSDNLIRLAQSKNAHAHAGFSRVSLAEIFTEAKRKVAPLAKRKNIKLTVPTSACQLRAEKNSIVELFVILFDNAIKYSSKGTTVEVSAKKTDGKVAIAVKDHGIGIAKGDLPHVFDRFYRADSARSKNGAKGYGLGLSIAQKIVDVHKGSIYVESTIGKGSVFTVQLPASA